MTQINYTYLKTIEKFKSINSDTTKKLKKAGLYDLNQIMAASHDKLVNIGLTALRISRIKEELKNHIIRGFESAYNILERRKKKIRLKTLIPLFDQILKGGLETQCIVEFHGAFGCGKTQMVHQLAYSGVCEKARGGFESPVIFLDTENTFRPERIVDIARYHGDSDLEIEKKLKNIHHCVVKSCNDQEDIMQQLSKGIYTALKCSAEPKLIIVDSIIANYRTEFLGREMLAERQRRLNKFLKNALNFAMRNNGLVVLTNQVSAIPNAMFGPTMKPVGGHVVGHAATYRFEIRRRSGVNRLIKIIDSPDLPNAEIPIAITKDGIGSIPVIKTGRGGIGG